MTYIVLKAPLNSNQPTICLQASSRLRLSQGTSVHFSRSPTWTHLIPRTTARYRIWPWCQSGWKGRLLGSCATTCRSTSYYQTNSPPTEPWGPLWPLLPVCCHSVSARRWRYCRSISTRLVCGIQHVDHTILLQRLRMTFDLNGTLLSWFCSYLDKCKKKLQFMHIVNSDWSKTAKIIKRQC